MKGVKRVMRAGLGLGLALGVSACAVLGSQPPADLYDITAVSEFEGRPGSGLHLGVAAPAAVEALDTNRIAVRVAPLTLQYYGAGLWADSLPELVQARLIQSFENSGRLRGVSGTGSVISQDLVIAADIRAFELRAFDKAAEVEIFVKLIDERSGRIIANRLFSARVPARDELGAATRALDAAFHQVAREIIDWTLTSV